jgi:class 3 adenylate cyclase
LKLKWTREGFPEVAIRIGIHTADVYAGNIGAPQRMKYGVLGES